MHPCIILYIFGRVYWHFHITYYFMTFITDWIQCVVTTSYQRRRFDVYHKEFESHKRSILNISVKFTEFMKRFSAHLSNEKRHQSERYPRQRKFLLHLLCDVSMEVLTYRHLDNIEPPNTHFSQVTRHFSGFCTSRRKDRNGTVGK